MNGECNAPRQHLEMDSENLKGLTYEEKIQFLLQEIDNSADKLKDRATHGTQIYEIGHIQAGVVAIKNIIKEKESITTKRLEINQLVAGIMQMHYVESGARLGNPKVWEMLWEVNLKVAGILAIEDDTIRAEQINNLLTKVQENEALSGSMENPCRLDELTPEKMMAISLRDFPREPLEKSQKDLDLEHAFHTLEFNEFCEKLGLNRPIHTRFKKK